MQKNKKRQSYLLKESALQNGKYGLVNELTNEWEIEPIYDYYYAVNFDFVTYLKEMKKLKQIAVKRALKSKRFKNNLISSYRANIASIQSYFGVSLIKHACDNYDEEYCFNSTNLQCIKCEYRFNNFEKFEEKGGCNE
ncbi:MAG: hypothetical protein RBT05_10285 [Bacteroidales bacterium]|jgi:hypothetical protein|nr:hypothetical protein [Bacteroidales bacterium]